MALVQRPRLFPLVAALIALLASGMLLLGDNSVSAGPATPANDDFANAIIISDPLPYSTSQSTAGATLETGEPEGCGVFTSTNSKTVWYTYTPGATGTVTLDISGSGIAAAAVIWEGASLGSLTNVVCDPFSQIILFQANAGETYAFQVFGLSGASGALDFVLSLNAPPIKGNDDFASSLEISDPLPFSNKQDTTGATIEDLAPCTRTNTVWYKYTPSTDVGLTADTLGSDFDALIAIVTDLNPATFNGSCWFGEVTFFVKAGVTVWFHVGANASNTGNLATSTGNLVFNLAEFPLVPVATPTPAPTPTPGGPEMVLNVKGGDCDDASQPTACAVPTGGEFTLEINAPGIPAEGYVLMQTFVEFGQNLTYKPSADAIEEILWPDCEPALALRSRIDQTRPFPVVPHINSHTVAHHSCITGLGAPLVPSSYQGNLVQFTLRCSPTPTSSNIRLLPFADVRSTIAGSLGSLYVNGAAPQQQVIPELGNLTINCVDATPAAVGGIALDTDLRPLPLDTTRSEGSPWGVAAGIIAAASLIAVGGAVWRAKKRLIG